MTMKKNECERKNEALIFARLQPSCLLSAELPWGVGGQQFPYLLLIKQKCIWNYPDCRWAQPQREVFGGSKAELQLLTMSRYERLHSQEILDQAQDQPDAWRW